MQTHTDQTDTHTQSYTQTHSLVYIVVLVFGDWLDNDSQLSLLTS